MTRMATGLVVIILSAASGCGASKEDAKKQLDELLGHMNTLGDILATIKDEPSAKAGMVKIKETGEKLKYLKDHELKITKSVENDLKKEYEKPLTDAGFKIGMEYARIQSIPGGKAAGDEAMRIIKSLEGK